MTIEHDIQRFAKAAQHGRFNGDDYNPPRDDPRLRRQVFRVFVTMIRGRWRTLQEITRITGDPEASVSAQLRHLRKPRFGSYIVEKRHRGAESSGLYEYRLLPPALEPGQGELELTDG